MGINNRTNIDRTKHRGSIGTHPALTFRSCTQTFSSCGTDQSDAAAIKYGILLGLIAIIGLTSLETSISTFFNTVSSIMPKR
jgi:Flp pilus assembly pilin Flp